MVEPGAVPDAVTALPAAPHPWQARVVAFGEVVLCSSLPTQFVIGAGLALAGLPALDADGTLSLPFVFLLSVLDTAALIALMVLLMRARGENPRALWIGTRPVGKEIRRGLLLVPLVFLLVVVLLNVLRLTAPWLHNVDINPLEQLAGTPIEAGMFAVVAIVAGGLREELQRAFLLRRFEQHLGGAAFGAIALSVAFGLGHFVQGWDAVITTGALGLFWAVLYLRRRSSVAPIVSHAGFNSLEILRVAIVGA
jgi:membrane protease YdiL (CAAX protease family)